MSVCVEEEGKGGDISKRVSSKVYVHDIHCSDIFHSMVLYLGKIPTSFFLSEISCS